MAPPLASTAGDGYDRTLSLGRARTDSSNSDHRHQNQEGQQQAVIKERQMPLMIHGLLRRLDRHQNGAPLRRSALRLSGPEPHADRRETS